MTLRSPTENENRDLLRFLTSIFRALRHSRMLLAGIQAEFGLDPRLKHSGVTGLRVVSRQRDGIFERDTKSTKKDFLSNFVIFTFVSFVPSW